MKKTVFTGVATALVTPMTKEGVDYPEFERLINWQIEEGVNGLVIAGTSGEAATLSDKEHREVLEFAVKVANHRVPIIAGTGSNDTDYAIDLTKYAGEIGCEAVLLVTPYYNKATQRGLYESFCAIADASTVPCILYNVPSRTGCNILPETCAKLAKHPNIVGVKEASGNISQIAETILLTRDEDFDVYSGNDDQVVPLMSLGGKGVISVVSNILPKKTVELCDKFFSGDVEGSRDIQLELLPLINSLFCEVNPIPAKAAVAAIGFGENYVRLPLTTMEPEHEEKMRALMREQGLNV